MVPRSYYVGRLLGDPEWHVTNGCTRGGGRARDDGWATRAARVTRVVTLRGPAAADGSETKNLALTCDVADRTARHDTNGTPTDLPCQTMISNHSNR